MKTDSGFRCPNECLLPDPRWNYLFDVVSFPIIDESYYGGKIRSYMAELKAIGVIVDLESARDVVVGKLVSLVSSIGLTSSQVFSLLKFFKNVKCEMPSLVSSVVSHLSDIMWVKTNCGYRYAKQTIILCDAEWAHISNLVDLPVIDEGFYGDEIFSFRDEMKMLGFMVSFRDCIPSVARSLKLPEGPLVSETACTLLHYVASLINSEESSDKSLLEDLLRKLRETKWLKTSMGYRCPHEARLFDMEWECYLKELDGPFIDQKFYRSLSSE